MRPSPSKFGSSRAPRRTVLKGDPNQAIKVRCGFESATLYKNLFFCPGINVPCIELNGEMISPRQFCIQSNKAKQKDWKGSIRDLHYGKSLRVLMQKGMLDFHDHANRCSNKCASRNFVWRDVCRDILKSDASNTSSPSQRNRVDMKQPTPSYFPIDDRPLFVTVKSEIDVSDSLALDAPVRSANRTVVSSGNHPTAWEQYEKNNSCAVYRQHLQAMMHADAETFWRKLAPAGLLEHAVVGTQLYVSAARDFSRQPFLPGDGMPSILSRLVSAAGIEKKIVQKITLCRQNNDNDVKKLNISARNTPTSNIVEGAVSGVDKVHTESKPSVLKQLIAEPSDMVNWSGLSVKPDPDRVGKKLGASEDAAQLLSVKSELI